MQKRIYTIAFGIVFFITATLFPSPSNAFYCSNCSREVMDILRQAKNYYEFVEQTKNMLEELGIETDSLGELFKQTAEALKQTEELIKQTDMDIRNLEQIGDALKNNPLELLRKLAIKTSELETKRADSNLLIQVFNELYPEQSVFAELAGASQEDIDEVNAIYQEHYDTWSRAINEATRATFRVSGDQLKELEEDGELREYISGLLNTPEANLQALQAANSLAAVQLDESRKLRALIATQAQESGINRMKTEKEDEKAKERLRKATATDQLKEIHDEPANWY